LSFGHGRHVVLDAEDVGPPENFFGGTGGRRRPFMLSEKAAVEARPLEKVLFLVVVGDERDSLAGL
jgi:hypothetical protein